MSGGELLPESAELHFKTVWILNVETRLRVSSQDLHAASLPFGFRLLDLNGGLQ